MLILTLPPLVLCSAGIILLFNSCHFEIVYADVLFYWMTIINANCIAQMQHNICE